MSDRKESGKSKVFPLGTEATTVDDVGDALDEIGGKEEDKEEGVGLKGGVTEDVAIDGCVVFHQGPFVMGNAVGALTIDGQGLTQGVGVAHLLLNHQHISVVLALALQGHQELGTASGIIDGREKAYLVVALELKERQTFGSKNDAIGGSLFIAGIVAGEGEGVVVLLHKSYLQLQLLGQPTVVAVAESDISSSGILYSLVAGVTSSHITFLHKDSQSRILLCIVFQDLLRVVGRTIIDKQQFPVLIGLGKNAFDAVSHVLSSIEGGHDDGDKVLLHEGFYAKTGAKVVKT